MKLRKRLDLLMENKIKELRYAIVQSVPVMLGYIFLGFAFGLMLNDAGYGFWWAFFISLFVYAGCNLSWLRCLQPEQACGIR